MCVCVLLFSFPIDCLIMYFTSFLWECLLFLIDFHMAAIIWDFFRCPYIFTSASEPVIIFSSEVRDDLQHKFLFYQRPGSGTSSQMWGLFLLSTFLPSLVDYLLETRDLDLRTGKAQVINGI